MADPTEAHRRFAADARAMFTALTEEGFTADQAVALLCQLIGQQPISAPPARTDRRAQVERLLAGEKKQPATRSPAEDRSANLWNPPAPEGAPAHE